MPALFQPEAQRAWRLAVIAGLAVAAIFASLSPGNAADKTPKKASGKKAKSTVGKPAGVEAGADNSRCLVCHINFAKEDLAAGHAQASLGCVKCHGDSGAHAADEDNLVAPDPVCEGQGQRVLPGMPCAREAERHPPTGIGGQGSAIAVLHRLPWRTASDRTPHADVGQGNPETPADPLPRA